MSVPIHHVLVVSLLLFGIGMVGVMMFIAIGIFLDWYTAFGFALGDARVRAEARNVAASQQQGGRDGGEKAKHHGRVGTLNPLSAVRGAT